MRYDLLNKNNVIGVFDVKKTDFGNRCIFEKTGATPLPIGFRYIDEWLNERKASRQNPYLRTLMQRCGCENPEGFINCTHVASLNDTFWVRSELEKVAFYFVYILYIAMFSVF